MITKIRTRVWMPTILISAITLIAMILLLAVYIVDWSARSATRTPASKPVPEESLSKMITSVTDIAIWANNVSNNDLETLLLVPGAFDVKAAVPGVRLWKGVEFKARMGMEDIFKFYKTQLLLRGWVLTYENLDDPVLPNQTYFWEDIQDSTPYIIRCSVSTMLISVSKVDPVNYVYLSLDRIPILDKTPIYPGAQSVEKVQQTLPPLGMHDIPPMKETLVTFKVDATRRMVEGYYKDTLGPYGWFYGGEAFDNAANAYIKGSLVFRWSMGTNKSGPIGASVILLAKEMTENETEVELHLRGTNRYSP